MDEVYGEKAFPAGQKIGRRIMKFMKMIDS
jgi:hypothetical protein